MELFAQAAERITLALENQSVVEAAENVANKTTIGGGGLAVLGGLTLNEWAIVIGIFLGVAGFCADLWFKRRRLKLLERHLACNPNDIKREDFL